MGNLCRPAQPPMVAREFADIHNAFALEYNTITDAMDSENFAARLFNPDATFKLGNFPASEGKDAIKAGAQNIFNMVAALRHDTTRVSSISDSAFMVEGTVTYTLSSGQVLAPINLCAKYDLDLSTKKLQRYVCYVDITPLFLALGMCISNDDSGNMKMEPRGNQA